MKRAAMVILIAVLTGLPLVAAAQTSEVDMLVLPHLGGNLAVNVDVVETAFFLEKEGRQRFHLVWQGNAEGKTLEGAEATAAWAAIRDRETDFLWASHMGGTLGIARRAIVSAYHMAAKEGRPATLRINYATDSKTIEGPDATALWATLTK